MATRKELVLGKGGGCSLKEEMAKVAVRNIRSKGHPYVELRENGKRFVFFCTLCLAPCYGETSLLNHLDGNLHAQRYAGAKLTLLGSNPWPFSDGVFFFRQSPEKETMHTTVPNSYKDRLLVANSNGAGAIVVKHKENTPEAMNNGKTKFNGSEENTKLKANGIVLGLSCDGRDIVVNANDHNRDLVIPGVLVNDEVSILGVKFIGYGHIASRIVVNDEIAPKVRRIWCAWLGDWDSNDQEMLSAAESDFSIVTFAYTYNLGRKAVVSDLGLLTSGFGDEIEYVEDRGKKTRRSFSDPEDSHDAQSDETASYEGECLYEHDSSEKALLQEDRSEKILTSRHPEGHIHETRLVLSRECRRDLRRQQRLAAERDCDVCKQPMLPGKDVATLLNRKTGNLACSSRNTNGV